MGLVADVRGVLSVEVGYHRGAWVLPQGFGFQATWVVMGVFGFGFVGLRCVWCRSGVAAWFDVEGVFGPSCRVARGVWTPVPCSRLGCLMCVDSQP